MQFISFGQFSRFVLKTLAFTTTTFGGMLASLIGGQLYDSLSVKTTLWIAFAVGAVGAVIMFIGTRKRK